MLRFLAEANGNRTPCYHTWCGLEETWRGAIAIIDLLLEAISMKEAAVAQLESNNQILNKANKTQGTEQPTVFPVI